MKLSVATNFQDDLIQKIKGKSVEELFGKLNKDFVELDDMIEAREKMSIKDIFEKKGEPYFRLVEKEVVKEANRCLNGGRIPGAKPFIDVDQSPFGLLLSYGFPRSNNG